MALKGERGYQTFDEVAWAWSGSTADRGGIACAVAVGSGKALGDIANTCNYAANPSGKQPVGLLLQDIVSVDTTKYYVNQHKNVAQSGQKVALIRKGWVVTDMISGTPTAGATAYLTSSGKLTATAGAAADTPTIGRFETTKDQDGYAKVFIDL